MSISIKHGFKNELVSLSIVDLQTTKALSLQIKTGRKYKQILSSIQEVGLIEPPVVTPLNDNNKYLLLDGHLRIMALKELGEEVVSCLISTDDEAYTYNKFVNRLSVVQENKMIIKAINAGVSEDKLAKTLNIDVRSLQKKKHMLDGICLEAVDLLKDKILSENTFRVLKKMKPARQIMAAMLMNDHNRYGYLFAKSLLDATPADQIVKGFRQKRISAAVLEKQIRLEAENLSLSEDIRSLSQSYGAEIINLTMCQSFIKQFISNKKISIFLEKYHSEIFKEFTKITEMKVLNTEKKQL
jgi:hypothetical protein